MDPTGARSAQDESPAQGTAQRFVRAGRLEAFPEGRGRRVMVEGIPVAVFRLSGGRLFALRDCCTHAEAALSGGTVKEEEGNAAVMCPRHGAHFDLETGEVLTLQAVRNVEHFEVKVEDGEVLVGTRASEAPPLWATGRHL